MKKIHLLLALGLILGVALVPLTVLWAEAKSTGSDLNKKLAASRRPEMQETSQLKGASRVLDQGREFILDEDYVLLASGVSNFEGSDENRIFNIEKGVREAVDGQVIWPDEEYSFVDALGGKSLEYEDGWKGALGIFRAEDLEEIPGGGICQVSTTLYRAALDAGLEIVEQRNHSLWVHYYDQDSALDGLEGRGLDATIYPGIQDLVVRNNYDSPIVIDAEIVGSDLRVDFWGIDDGREVVLEGPDTASTYGLEIHKAVGVLGLGDIVWKQIITWPDERKEVNWYRSTYFRVVPQHED